LVKLDEAAMLGMVSADFNSATGEEGADALGVNPTPTNRCQTSLISLDNLTQVTSQARRRELNSGHIEIK